MSDRRRKKTPDDPPPATANPEAEAALLGMILVDDRNWHDVADRIKEFDFASERNRNIWRGMSALVAAGKSIIRQVLLAEIGEDAKEDEIDLAGYLRALQAGGKDQRGVITEFADAIKSASAMRQGIEYGEWIKEQFSQARISRNVEELLGEAKHRLSLIGTAEADDARRLNEIAEFVVSESQAIRNKEKPTGLKTGMRFVDSLIGSMLPGQLIVIAGAAGMGKTALGMQIGLVLSQMGIPVHAFSLEMESEEVAGRMLAAASKAAVTADKIAEGEISDEQLESVVQASRSFRELPFYIDARARPTTATIMARANRSVAKNGTRLFVTDHLRMVRPDNPKAEERERLEQVVQDHKSMAKRLGVPWILLAHTSRYDLSHVRTGKDIRRPTMHNLYGSSAIENTADVVLFVHRPWVILQDVRPPRTAKHYDEWCADCDRTDGKAYIVLGKRRGGKGRGNKECLFKAETTWFLDKPDEPNVESL